MGRDNELLFRSANGREGRIRHVPADKIFGPLGVDPDAVSVAMRNVISKRSRQIHLHGHTAGQDDHLHPGQLAVGGLALLSHAITGLSLLSRPGADTGLIKGRYPLLPPSSIWPFPPSTWPGAADPRGHLVTAAAMIIAEIDRMDREAKEGTQ